MGRSHKRRPAFTLIELLVVILIILMLAGMMVAITPGASARSQGARAATTLQGALLYARSRAKMNMLPTGVALNASNVNAVWVGQGQQTIVQQDTVQFIQSGGDYAKGFAFGGGNQVTLTLPPAAGTILTGDYIEIAGSGLPHIIADPNNPQLGNPVGNPIPLLYGLQTSFPPPTPNYPGVEFRIMRQPRQLYGEAPVEFPQNYCVDLTPTSPMFTVSTSFMMGTQCACPISVLFAPSGALTGQAACCDVICYVVRDTTQPGPWQTAGFPSIVAVWGKTGLITAHPINTNQNLYMYGNQSTYPYYFALNSKTSG